MGFWECWTFRWCHLPVTLAVKGNSSGHWIHLFLYFIGIFIIANYFQKTIRKTAKIVRLNLDSVPKCYIIHFLNWHKVTIWYKIKMLWGFLCRWYAMAENALRWNLAIIELFSIDTQMACETCGFIAYNDTLSCVQWCQYARKCVGDEMYDHMMAIAASQKERAAHLRSAPKKDSAQ